jgi:oxygen-independent coproporphyrinogen-3 oxidase
MMQGQSMESNDANSVWRPSIAPQSAYLHIPFCRHRCGYCNFSLVANRDYLVERFLKALETELGWLDRRFVLTTLFLGGGTPSHLTSDQFRELKRIVQTRFDFEESTEITAECNPNDLDPEKCEALAEFGVNRVSLGVQSLHFEKLKRLERDHSPDDVHHAVGMARQFARSVSIDLIFAAPDETPVQWAADLDAALQLDPDHLSAYELTYEKGTQFWNRRLHQTLNEAEEDLRAEMYEIAIEKIELAGLAQYEISSFAKPEQQCRHNEVYWIGEPYFAFGPGAARYLDGWRQMNHQSTIHYLKCIERGQLPIAVSEKLTPLESARELLAIGLRRVEGIYLNQFTEKTGFAPSQLLGRNREQWIEQGMLMEDCVNLRLSRRGRFVADWIATQILS